MLVTRVSPFQLSCTCLECDVITGLDSLVCPVAEDGCGVVAQVANRAGSLADITGVIASHGINVQSLAVGSSEQPGRSRITVVVPRDDAGFADLKQKVYNIAALLLVF